MEQQLSYNNNTLEKTMEVFFLPLCTPGASHLKLLQIINIEMDYVSLGQCSKISLAVFRNIEKQGVFFNYKLKKIYIA